MDELPVALREQAWNYFEIVAQQRLTVLNFYIAVSSVIASVQFAMLQGTRLSRAGVFLGCLLVFLSYVFSKWDRRSSDMIKVAEETLMYFEDASGVEDQGGVPHVAKIVHREEYMTSRKKQKKSILFWRNYYTYRTCLNLVFSSFALVGLIGIVLNLI